MVEPEQELLGAGGCIAPGARDLRRIFLKRIGAGGRAVGAEALLVGAMIVRGGPVRPARGGPRSGTIVVVRGHDVMEAERHRVVHDGLAGGAQHCAERRDHVGVAGERHARPFLGNVA